MSEIKVPKVGDRGREHVGSDCYPITCSRVSKSGKTVWFKRDDFKGDKENGHDYFGQQKWIFTERPDAPETRCDWSAKRERYQKNGYGSIFFDGWHAKQDPHF